jgi:hypothetical protein
MRKLALVLVLAIATSAAADDTTTLLARAWPYAPFAHVSDLGHGVAIVFSPDLSVPGNCRFYTALGFACFEDTDWSRVLDGIREYNAKYPDRYVRTLILETHGTNGHGLRLQKNKNPKAERSYISVGALQEQLEPEGLRYILISACNSGRLLRPEIYRNLNPNPGDKLFLPATCGIIGASDRWNPLRSRVTVITPAASTVEMTVVGSVREFTTPARKAVLDSALAAGVKAPKQFVVSDMVMRIITGDEKLRLHQGTPVEKFSKLRSSAAVSEKLFKRFVSEIDARARREQARLMTRR